jgi:formylglycine-generating enzyme required for sulfatase activity
MRATSTLREGGIAIVLGIGIGLIVSYVADPHIFDHLMVRASSPRDPQSFIDRIPPSATRSIATLAPAQASSTPAPSPTSLPFLTSTPDMTPTAALEQSTVPAPSSAPEGMLLIPAGYFQMGSSQGEPNEAPEHPVLLDAFYLDQYEITNAQYQQCVAAGGCTEPRRERSATRADYLSNPAYADYPVVAVMWDQAEAYCTWAGKRLPTEAEWEYAASGPENRKWPWGNKFDADLSAASASDTQPVGSYPEGVSVFGVYDLAGNVAEWVADKYDHTFFPISPPRNPRAEGGIRRIYRGGGFANSSGSHYTTSRRYIETHDYYDVQIGFRCALDIPKPGQREPSPALISEFCQVFQAYKPEAACP